MYADLGIPQKASISNGFPMEVNSDYEAVYDSFIDTAAVKDIDKKWPQHLSTLYVAMAFASYIRTIDRRSVPNLDFLGYSLDLINLKPIAERIYAYLYRNRFLNHMRQYTHDIEIVNYEYNEFLTAYLNVRIRGTVSYKTKGRHTLDGQINNEIKPLVFPRMLPDVLKTTQRNGKPRKMLSLSQIKTRPSEWYKLVHDKDPEIILEVARAKFGTLVFRYEFEIPHLIFSSNNSKSKVMSAVLKKWHRVRKL